MHVLDLCDDQRLRDDLTRFPRDGRRVCWPPCDLVVTGSFLFHVPGNNYNYILFHMESYSPPILLWSQIADDVINLWSTSIADCYYTTALYSGTSQFHFHIIIFISFKNITERGKKGLKYFFLLFFFLLKNLFLLLSLFCFFSFFSLKKEEKEKEGKKETNRRERKERILFFLSFFSFIPSFFIFLSFLFIPFLPFLSFFIPLFLSLSHFLSFFSISFFFKNKTDGLIMNSFFKNKY